MQPAPNSTAPTATTAEKTGGLASGWALILAAWFGLIGGYLDLGLIFLKRDVFHASLYYELGRHFRWTLPVANWAIVMVPGLLVAVVNCVRPGLISWRFGTFLFATLAIWEALLRAPFYALATLFVAIGTARLLSRWLARHSAGFQRFASFSLAVLVVTVVATAVVSLRREALAKAHATARLPAPPAGARNVLLIVMDTVRADSLSLYGYGRETAPQLSRWAKKGVRFDWALAPAPWTFPSHGSFLTGQWPSTLGAHWQPTMNPAYPTLAEFLAARGYLTAGFAANTHWCSYESGMDRGFVHYEDYPLTVTTALGGTILGRWLVENLRYPHDYYAAKWIRSLSRDAAEINRSLLDWLARQRGSGRPFFAFLNYLDAHEPFVPPGAGPAHFGRRPASFADYSFLLDYWDRDKLKLSEREIELARDAYEDCIAALDREVGALLDELERREMLRDTVVIVTSDHGEQFGEHGVFNHGFSLYLQDVHVPLLIVSPTAPAGRTVSEPVSLRDLPATIVDAVGMKDGSPFPGRSLTECWRPEPGTETGERHGSPAFSEVDIPNVIIPQRGPGPNQRGFTTSLVNEGRHYMLDIRGNEELYEVANDPEERRDLKKQPDPGASLNRMREALAVILRDNRAPGGAAADFQKQLLSLLGSMLPRRPLQ